MAKYMKENLRKARNVGKLIVLLLSSFFLAFVYFISEKVSTSGRMDNIMRESGRTASFMAKVQ